MEAVEKLFARAAINALETASRPMSQVAPEHLCFEGAPVFDRDSSTIPRRGARAGQQAALSREVRAARTWSLDSGRCRGRGGGRDDLCDRFDDALVVLALLDVDLVAPPGNAAELVGPDFVFLAVGGNDPGDLAADLEEREGRDETPANLGTTDDRVRDASSLSLARRPAG
jgi:hypothetical protein